MKNHTPVFSIVVPVYNTEKYLNQCLESLANQTETNIEIIVVDDGSTDNSGRICDEWAGRDKRICVIHQNNSGVVKACRKGFEVANGLYFAKVDSDDWVEKDFYETLGRNLINENLDMIIADYISESFSAPIKTQYKKNCIMSGYELIKEHGRVHTSADICYSWRMAFKKSFLKEKGLFFGEGMRIGEDTVLNVTALAAAKRVMAIDYAGYHYRDNNTDSVMRQVYKASLEHDLSAQYAVRRAYFSDIDSYMYDLSVYYITCWLYGALSNCKNSPEGIRYKDIKRILNTKWVTDSFKYLGFKLPFLTKKEYVMALVAKFKLSLLYYLYYKVKG